MMKKIWCILFHRKHWSRSIWPYHVWCGVCIDSFAYRNWWKYPDVAWNPIGNEWIVNPPLKRAEQ